MKKTIVSSIIIVAFVLYGVIHSRASTSFPVNTSIDSGSSNATGTSSSNPSQISPSITTSSSGFKDGTYTGSAVNAFYGNIQVRAVISRGKLIDVKFLQYPNDRDQSIEINQYSNPILAQEAIQTQSAQVDIVSGATDTSDAFIQSLTSALEQAKS